MKKMLYLLIAGLMVSVIIIGCSTEKPWEAGDVAGLELVIVSAPDSTTDVFSGSSVSFSWSATGGSGVVAGYRWYLEPLEATWRTSSNYTTTTYENVLSEDDTTALDYIFHVEATDSEGDVDIKTAEFTVMAPAEVIPDTDAPVVTITQGPADDSYVATGTSIAFVWTGDDGHGNDDMIEYQYAYPALDDTVDWGSMTNAAFTNLASNDPAIFYVRGRDQADNISDWESVSFVVRSATILYIDDFLWLDAVGNPDMPKERDQKQFYRDALEGYAFSEWDIALQGYPDTTDLVVGGVPVYSTIIMCSDSQIGTTDGTPWFWLGDHEGPYDGGAMRYHLESGGNFLLTGALAVLDMSNMYGDIVPPGDFEFDWLGVDSVEWAYDYWYEFTWAVKDPATELDLPDSMKIDVAKNGDQDDYAMEFPGLRNDDEVTTEVIFDWGLWVDGSEPAAYGHPVGYICSFDGTPQTANLAFDTYSMPPDAIQQTFRAILTEFGE